MISATVGYQNVTIYEKTFKISSIFGLEKG